jgi:hypothetical protein
MGSPLRVPRGSAKRLGQESGAAWQGPDGRGKVKRVEGGDMDQDEPHYPPNAVHLVRTTQMAHVHLSAMADQKASILMGATFVIFTLSIGQVRGGEAPLPLLILGAAAFFSAIFAVLAVIPAIKAPRDAEPNLLFFGSFAQLGEDDYVARLTALLQSDDEVYRTMARDIYQNGCVLARKKYRLLGYAYRIFLAGLVTSFVVAVVDLVTLGQL